MLRGALNGITGMRIHATDGDSDTCTTCTSTTTGGACGTFTSTRVTGSSGDTCCSRRASCNESTWDDGRIHTTLSRRQIRESPDIETHKQVRLSLTALAEGRDSLAARSVGAWGCISHPHIQIVRSRAAGSGAGCGDAAASSASSRSRISFSPSWSTMSSSR